jgi:hypothetical protein
MEIRKDPKLNKSPRKLPSSERFAINADNIAIANSKNVRAKIMRPAL